MVPLHRTPKSFTFMLWRGAPSCQSASTVVSVAEKTGVPSSVRLAK
jgi:hypothetical protein